MEQERKLSVEPGSLSLHDTWIQLKDALAAFKPFVVEEKSDEWPRHLIFQRKKVRVKVEFLTTPAFAVCVDPITATKFGLKSIQPYKPRGRTGQFDIPMLAYRVASIFHRSDEADNQAIADREQRDAMSKAIEDMRPFPDGVIIWPREGHYGFEYHHFKTLPDVYEYLQHMPEKTENRFTGKMVEVVRHAESFGLKIDHGLTEDQIRTMISKLKS